MNTFKNDLELSRIFELELIKHLGNVERFEQVPSDKAFTEYDIKIFMSDGAEETYEVKCDFKSTITKNICIEYQQFRGGVMKKTGISKSKAKYWAIFSPIDINNYELFIITRKRLIKMINNQEYFDQKKTFDQSYIVLFKKDQIKNNSTYYKRVIN